MQSLLRWIFIWWVYHCTCPHTSQCSSPCCLLLRNTPAANAEFGSFIRNWRSVQDVIKSPFTFNTNLGMRIFFTSLSSFSLISINSESNWTHSLILIVRDTHTQTTSSHKSLPVCLSLCNVSNNKCNDNNIRKPYDAVLSSNMRQS